MQLCFSSSSFLGLIKIYYLGPAFLKQADFYKYTKYIKEGVRVRKSEALVSTASTFSTEPQLLDTICLHG